MDRRQLFSLAPLAGGLLALAATAPASASSEGGGEKAPKDSYVRFGTITSTILRPDGRRGVMSVETGLDIPDAELRTQAAMDGPRLRAAFNTVVQSIAARLLPGTAPDVDQLHHELQVATIRTLRKRGAVVLLGTVMVV
ncbi:hypothetical protein BH10PSE1_BH10PSE1_10490 [soil metagenome]